MSEIALSLVIASFNRAKPLERLLRCLEQQSLQRAQWEVIVAVDGSTDETIELLEKWRKNSSLPLSFFWQKNSGQSVARHSGIEQARGEHIVVIDDDMELRPQFLEEHLKASKSVSGKTVVIGRVQSSENWQQAPLYEAVREDFMQRLHKNLQQNNVTPSATSFITQNVSFPRDLYLSVGGFDKALRLDEDRELGMRFERAGASFVFAEKASAIHRSAIGSYEKWFQRQYDYGKYAVQVWEKYHRDVYLHPLRNFVNGSKLNRWLVTMLLPRVLVCQLFASFLRIFGNVLKRVGLFELALATHKAIITLQYHRGVEHALGGQEAFWLEEKKFLSDPNRPREPTALGKTF